MSLRENLNVLDKIQKSKKHFLYQYKRKLQKKCRYVIDG